MRTVYIYCEGTHTYECSGINFAWLEKSIFSSLCTCLKLPLRLCSQSIMSWKMGIMTFLRSGCGTSVTSRNGPIIAGMKFSLCSPGGETEVDTEVTLSLYPWTRRIVYVKGNLSNCGQLWTSVLFSLKNSTTIQAAVIIWFKCTALQ